MKRSLECPGGSLETFGVGFTKEEGPCDQRKSLVSQGPCLVHQEGFTPGLWPDVLLGFASWCRKQRGSASRWSAVDPPLLRNGDLVPPGEARKGPPALRTGNPFLVHQEGFEPTTR